MAIIRTTGSFPLLCMYGARLIKGQLGSIVSDCAYCCLTRRYRKILHAVRVSNCTNKGYIQKDKFHRNGRYKCKLGHFFIHSPCFSLSLDTFSPLPIIFTSEVFKILENGIISKCKDQLGFIHKWQKEGWLS